MSLDSSFWLDAKITAEDASKLLAGSGDFTPAPRIEKGLRLIAEGTILTLFERRPAIGPFEDAGITPTLHLFFANSDKENTAGWTRNTVRAVATLLAAVPGDALFLYCSDSPALTRKDGKLILDRRCGLWQDGVEPNVLPIIALPFEFGIIEVN